MAKELPYFRFTAHEWLNDDISLESYEVKGLFADVCAYYWSQDCECTLAKLQKRFSNAINLLKKLIDSNIIKHENKHDKIKIDFLLIQYDLLSDKRKLRQVAGSKGGNAKAKLEQKGSYKYNNNNKDNNKDKDNNKSEIDVFFNDLENSREIETIAIRNNWTVQMVKSKIPEFRTKAELSYPTFQKFISHFKNWIVLNPPKDPTKPKMVY